MLDVSSAFDDFLEPAILRRKTAGSRDENGNWITPVPTETTIQVVAQSLTADERLALPEAVRTKETFKFHTTTELKTSDEVAQTNADIIVFDSIEWEISSVHNRKNLGNYFKAIGIKQ